MRDLTFAYCVVVATPDELRDLRYVFDKVFADRAAEDSSSRIARVIARPPRSEPIRVLATIAEDMGNLSCAIRTSQIMAAHKPDVVFLVGSAASLDPEAARVGDVIIPKKAHLYTYDKVVEEGQAAFKKLTSADGFSEYFMKKSALDKRIRNSHPMDGFSEVVSMLPNEMDFAEIQEGPSQSGPDKSVSNPKVIFDGEMVTCDMVVNSAEFRDHLIRQQDRKTYALDMESFGFFEAVKSLRHVYAAKEGSSTIGLIVKGISDYAADKERLEGEKGTMRSQAVRNAVLTACSLIRIHYDAGVP